MDLDDCKGFMKKKERKRKERERMLSHGVKLAKFEWIYYKF